MASRAGVQSKKKNVIVDLGDGDNLTVYIRPGAYDETAESDFIDAAEKAKKSFPLMCDLICKVAEGWDMKETDDPKSAIAEFNRQELGTYPAYVVAAIFTAIMEALNPSPKSSRI
jgi:hypothetical protein